MSIAFAGVPLLYESPEIAEFLERYVSVEGSNYFTENISAGYEDKYTRAPDYAFNVLQIPVTGANRFTRFIGLADDETKQQLESKAKKADLVLDDGNTTITTELHRLSMRPITGIPGPGRLWAVPLVDYRYWFNEQATISTDSWGLYFQFLGFPGVTTPAWALNPDKDSLQNGASIARAEGLEIGAGSCGMLGVMQPHGIFLTFEQLTEADTDANKNRQMDILAGDFYASESDEAFLNVAMSFPQIREGKLTGASYTVTKPTSAPGAPTRTLYVASTAWAEMTGQSGTTPTNQTALDALCENYALAVGKLLAHRYDITTAGLSEWTHTVFDDWITHAAGKINALGQRVCYSRFQSLPANSWPALQFSQDYGIGSATRLYDNVIKGTTQAEITAGGAGDVTIDYATVSPTYTVRGYLDHAHGGEKVSSGNEVFLTYMEGADVFQPDLGANGPGWIITGVEPLVQPEPTP